MNGKEKEEKPYINLNSQAKVKGVKNNKEKLRSHEKGVPVNYPILI